MKLPGRYLTRLLACALVVAVAGLCTVATAPSAWAEDESAAEVEKANPLTRLSAEELEAVRRKVPGFDEMDPSMQRGIARRVLHLRLLTPEQRKRLTERVARLRTSRHEHGPDHRRGRGADPAMLAHALSEIARAELTPELRERLKTQGITTSSFGRVLIRAVWPRLVAFEAQALLDAGVESLPADLQTGRMRGKIDESMARLRDPEITERDKRRQQHRLGGLLLGRRLAAFHRQAITSAAGEGDGASPHDPRARGKALAAYAMARWGDEIRAELTKVQTQPGRIVGTLRRYDVAQQVRNLDRLLTKHLAGPAHAEGRAKAADLQRYLLTEVLKVPVKSIAALPGHEDAHARSRALRELLAPFMGQGRGMASSGEGRWRGQRGDRGDRRRPGRGAPGGGRGDRRGPGAGPDDDGANERDESEAPEKR